jgi:hypothetical protein
MIHSSPFRSGHLFEQVARAVRQTSLPSTYEASQARLQGVEVVEQAV